MEYWEWEAKKEEGILDHWSHKHPLCLVESGEGVSLCYGCIRSVSSLIEGQIYVCSKRCGSDIAFHKECAELPRKIRHPFHHQHILMIQEHDLDSDEYDRECVFCKRDIEESMSYSCTSSECHTFFHMHLRCAQAWGAVAADHSDDDSDDDDVAVKKAVMHRHRSHPKHELMAVRRSAGGSHSFKCDACGIKERGDSYLCTVCSQFWIHQKCAALPDSIATPHHHHHLSLSFRFPRKYIHYDVTCGICFIAFIPKYWIYHCRICKFAVHISCALKPVDVRYPMTDVVKERITPFVEALIRGKLAAASPDETIKYEVPFHKHKLSLIISQPPAVASSDSELLICDGCITPILSHRRRKDLYILSCSDCKYILHWACSQLPSHLPSLPLHNHHDHELALESCSKLEFEAKCKVCDLYTNGLMYVCKACDFKADIKCAVLPDSIYHEGHHHDQHLLTHFSKEEMLEGEFGFRIARVMCGAAGCEESTEDFDCFMCSTCNFYLHVRCAVLPETMWDRSWDKHNHPLLLTYGTSNDNDMNIYCDCCEEEISPKDWVYRCDPCDLSFHPRCFPAFSGEYRNIKFGQEYTIAAAHPHPLAYRFLSMKRRCDICRRDAYGLRGFQCESCYFFICLDECAQPLLQDIRPFPESSSIIN